MQKKELRAQMVRRNRALTAAERAAASARIFDRVERLPEFAAARTVAAFASLADEPDTAERLARWSTGRTLVLPRVEGAQMRFCRYDPATMRPGAFGIAEPGPDAEPCAPAEIDLAIVPGTAFTASGCRCGRGRGYYDRYLSQPEFRGTTVGVCYAHQLVGELPTEPHDVRMDRVVTD